MKALILVDLQNDFCKNGSLAVPNGDEVIAIANVITSMGFFDLITASQDFHPRNHGSFASNHINAELFSLGDLNGFPQTMWPDHCVAGSEGARLHSMLDMNKVATIFRKGMDSTVDSYSAFFDNQDKNSTGLGDYLGGLGVTDVYIMGLALDFCVKATALDALRFNFKNVYLIADACRGVNMDPNDSQKAIDEMKNAGIIITNSWDL